MHYYPKRNRNRNRCNPVPLTKQTLNSPNNKKKKKKKKKKLTLTNHPDSYTALLLLHLIRFLLQRRLLLIFDLLLLQLLGLPSGNLRLLLGFFLAFLGRAGFAALHLAPVLLVLLASLALLALGFGGALHREIESLRE